MRGYVLNHFHGHWETIFRGEKESRELLFSEDDHPDGDGSENTIQQRVFSQFNAIIRECVLKVIDALPAGVHARILEIGTGAGITTSALLAFLPPDRTHYTCSDVSLFFLDLARKRFASYPFMDFHPLDIEQPPREQGGNPYGFDIVIATLMAHVTRNIGETLQHVRSLLAPGGLFFISQASLIENRRISALERTSILVKIQRGDDSSPPLLCIHPAGGGVVRYLNVACYMPGRTVYGIQTPFITGKEEPFGFEVRAPTTSGRFSASSRRAPILFLLELGRELEQASHDSSHDSTHGSTMRGGKLLIFLQ